MLVSEHLDAVVAPLARRLGAEAILCNRMEIVDGRATGTLLEPFVGGHAVATVVKDWAAQNGVSLTRAAAYGSAQTDGALLSSVGLPCAVAPDYGLRTLARDLDWPIVEAA